MVCHELMPSTQGAVGAQEVSLPSAHRSEDAGQGMQLQGGSRVAKGQMPLINIMNLQHLFSQVFLYSHWTSSEPSIRTDSCCQRLTLVAPASPVRLLREAASHASESESAFYPGPG